MPSVIICDRPYGCEAAGRCLSPDPDNDCGVNLADAPEPIPYLTDEQRAVERSRAAKDSELVGVGYLVDGRHVAPQRVTRVARPHWPDMTTTELWNQLRGVLEAKGASPDWIEYALPDLQVAAIGYAGSTWAQGYRAHEQGDAFPNPGAQTPIPWNQPGSTEQTLGQALAEHGTGGDTYV